MNAGANGQETANSVTRVLYLTPEGEIKEFQKKDIIFRYRYSSFQEGSGVILEATFSLEPSKLSREKQLAIIGYRKSTQPYGEKSAGCIFRNPKGGGAGALIEEAGLKGMSEGDAEVSQLHANFIINRDQACAKDVLKLIERVKAKIKEKTGVELAMEIRYVPYE
jgi:UDP-N-acetylmuramate dehydrogenase